MSKNDRLDVFEKIQIIFRKYDNSVIENRPKLLGLLRDYGSEYEGEIRLLMIAFDEGIPKRYLSKEIRSADIKQEAKNFAARTGLDPEVARKTIHTWFAISELLRGDSRAENKAIRIGDDDFIGLKNSEKDDSWVVPLANFDRKSRKASVSTNTISGASQPWIRALVAVGLIAAGSSYFFREQLSEQLRERETGAPVEKPVEKSSEQESQREKGKEDQRKPVNPDGAQQLPTIDPNNGTPVPVKGRGIAGYTKLSPAEPFPTIRALRPDNRGEGLIFKFSIENDGQMYNFLSYMVHPQNGRAGGLIELKNADGSGTKTDLLAAHLFESGPQSYFSMGGALTQNIL